MQCAYRHCTHELPDDSKKFYHTNRCRIKEHALRRNERKPKPKPVHHQVKKCICPCGKEFTDTTCNQKRVFYDRGICRYAYFKANKAATYECKARGKSGDRVMDSKSKKAPVICHRKGLFSGKVACHNYGECLEKVAMRTGTWKHIETGDNCYEKPREVPQNTMGGSFANAMSRGFSFT